MKPERSVKKAIFDDKLKYPSAYKNPHFLPPTPGDKEPKKQIYIPTQNNTQSRGSENAAALSLWMMSHDPH